MDYPHSDQLTRHPDELAPGVADLPLTWVPHRDRLRAELAPQSLTDRIVAEGVERIVCRYWDTGYDEGYHDGVQGGFRDALMWIAAARETPGVRADSLAFRLLWELETRIGQELDAEED